MLLAIAAHGMLHSDFCALPRGEGANPGRRLIDAVAAYARPPRIEPRATPRATCAEGAVVVWIATAS